MFVRSKSKFLLLHNLYRKEDEYKLKISEKEFIEQYFVELSAENNKYSHITNIINRTLVYYVRKAHLYKVMFYILSIIAIIFNSSIPIISQLSITHGAILVTILSSVATIFTSISMLFGTKDLWVRYRMLAEILKNECIQYNAKIGLYRNQDIAIEVLISKFRELQQIDYLGWQNYRKQNNDISVEIINGENDI